MDLALQGLQRQACIAQVPTDVNIVPHLGAAAQQGLGASVWGRHLAKHGDADVEGAARGVATDQFALVFIGQSQQASGKRRQPGFIHLG